MTGENELGGGCERHSFVKERHLTHTVFVSKLYLKRAGNILVLECEVKAVSVSSSSADLAQFYSISPQP